MIARDVRLAHTPYDTDHVQVRARVCTYADLRSDVSRSVPQWLATLGQNNRCCGPIPEHCLFIGARHMIDGSSSVSKHSRHVAEGQPQVQYGVSCATSLRAVLCSREDTSMKRPVVDALFRIMC